jgi:glycosyltransferase involved in cell wall biosynthesis
MPIDLVGGSFVYNTKYLEEVKSLCGKPECRLYLNAPDDLKITLLQSAKAVLIPSAMNEPFNLVAVEAAACLPKSSLIPVPSGSMVLDEAKPGNSVFSTSGIAKVTKTFSRAFEGKLVVIRGRGMLPVSFTPNHPILVNRDGKETFVQASSVVKETDRLVLRRTPPATKYPVLSSRQ